MEEHRFEHVSGRVGKAVVLARRQPQLVSRVDRVRRIGDPERVVLGKAASEQQLFNIAALGARYSLGEEL